MELNTVDRVKAAFFRLVDTESDDPELVLHGEGVSDVVELALTAGFRSAQRWMLDKGFQGWRKRSSAITWSGTDAADGGRYWSLPTDFLKAYGNARISCLTEAGGDRWGEEVHPDYAAVKGNSYYFRGSDDGGMQLWLSRSAAPPSTLYMEYHYLHPSWTALADADIDFPLEIRSLGVAEAANEAMVEAWLPGGQELEVKILRALGLAQTKAMRTVRASKKPREMRKPSRFGNHWAIALLLGSLAATPFAAKALPVPGLGDDVGVLRIVGVAPCTVSLASVAGSDAIATHDVLGTTDRLKVVRIDAMPHPTEMVNVEPIGYRSNEQFVEYAVNVPVPLLLCRRIVRHLALGVPVGVAPADPFPTIRLGADNDSFSEPLGNNARDLFHREHDTTCIGKMQAPAERPLAGDTQGMGTISTL